jgi:predicted deacetylase
MSKLHKSQLAIVTIHHACPTKKIFSCTDELENLGINYNIAHVPFFNEKQDLPRFPKFVERIRNCKGEIALHGLYHELKSGQLDDFHTRSRATTEVELRAGLEIFKEIRINANVFVPLCWKLNATSTRVLEKLRFKLAEIQERFLLLNPRKLQRIPPTKALSWDSYGDPKKNLINIGRMRRRFKRLIQKAELIRIALHPRDPIHSLNDKKEMILQLQDHGYKILHYRQLISKLQMRPA